MRRLRKIKTGQVGAGRIVWIDRLTHDDGRARAFYAAVFGWSFMQSEDPGYPQIIRGCQGETATGYHSPRPWGHYGYPAGHVVVSGPGLPDIDDGPVAAPLRSGGVSMHDFGPSAGFEDVDF